ncbi:endonuclease domain-containing protein [Pararhizobium arenae]|uniref:endonuclease domain-containing protein n=1 Tax=Pararhizobium arenae TaxID=1856850 RepID=UPI00094B0DE7|nr:endonuclease domain-containing protein [Pararhizobium arenae]
MPHADVRPATRKNARSMRKVMTDAELKLWNELRAHRLMGLGFRRQLPISGYIADFACPEHRIIVEVDGSGHGDDKQIRHDASRDQILTSLGWTVLRFWNGDVLTDMDGVCSHIVRVVEMARK